MISLRRPSASDVEHHRTERLDAAPTCLPSPEPPAGFHHDLTTRVVAVSRPGIALVRAAAPITRVIQRRATEAYLDALAAWIADGPST